MFDKELASSADADLEWERLSQFIKEIFSHLPEPAENIEDIEDFEEIEEES